MKLFLSVIAIASLLSLHAQNVILVQNGSNTSPYSQLDAAFTAANNGDTIYIPGGSYTLSLPINKRIHIIGAGHYPDSTLATGVTIITFNNSINNGADNGSISGVYFTAGISFGITGDLSSTAIVHYTLDRCFIPSITFNNGSSLANNNLITNCVIGSINGSSIQNNSFLNNIIQGQVSNFAFNNVFKNNIFTKEYCGGCYYTSTLLCINDCLFENNIFVKSFFSEQCIYQNNTFRKNINAVNSLFGYFANNNGTNNYTSVLPDQIFQDYTGATFRYTDDYHLQNPLTFLGTDGTQVGIYGGILPWKEGSVPSNPHIQFKSISGTTDSNGNLQINFKVKAQDR